MQFFLVSKCQYHRLNFQFSALRIVSFQEDGYSSSESFLNHSLGIGPDDLVDFTVCLRFNLNFLRGREQFFLAYANDLSEDALTGSIIQDDRKPMRLQLCIDTKKKICLNHQLQEDIFQQWHHICLLLKKTEEGQSLLQFYYDGSLGNVKYY